MPEEEYPYRFYPEYCLGHVCAATPATISALVGAAHTTPHLWIDDVWSFGIVAWEAEVSFRQLEINRNTTFHEPFLNGRVAAQVLDSYEDGLPLFKAVHAKLLS
ncbi:hypothetical protein Q1695_011419 [Nippostrongylus brasiliensis]|nr:hypothetical protein Q1695_011419 [Nippostrongylus brasiliensis]